MNGLKGHLREIVLGIVLLVIVLWYFMPAAPPDLGDTAAGATKEGDGVAALVKAINSLQNQINTAAFLRTSSNYDGGGRNLFDYGKIVPPPPSPEELARLQAEREEAERKRREAAEEAEKLRQEALKRQREEAAKRQAERAAQQATPPTPAKPVPPPINLKFIGVVGDVDDPIAVFLDGTDFVLAHKGEVVKTDFRVKEISYDSLEIGFTDPRFAGENRILPMGG